MHKNIVENEKNKVCYLTFPLFEKLGVKHAFSTKKGGVSKGDYAEMNLSFTRGDNPEDVMNNHRFFAEAVGYKPEQLVLSNQVHGTVVRRVDAADAGTGVFREPYQSGVDGLITNDANVVLMAFFADCVPLFFYDPVSKAAGVVHSGWRGTVKRIGAVAVEKMRQEFGTKPENLYAVIGPSICSSCYEVSEDVALEFEKYDVLEKKQNQKYQLDLWTANKIILEEAGIPGEQIEISGLCTHCHSDLMFSYRATGERRGNLAGIITLQQ